MSDPLDSYYDFTESIDWEAMEARELLIGDEGDE